MAEEFVVRVVRGEPDDTELAALVAVLSALVSQSTVDNSAAVAEPAAWDLVPRPREAPRVGDGAWRASGLPH